MSTTNAAERFPVGEFLTDELEERGWTQVEFAEVLGRPPQFVSEIIAGKKEITRESAAQIGAALGTSAQTLLNLQDSYHLWRHSQDAHARAVLEEVRLRARLQELAPISVLLKRGYLTATTAREQEAEILRLYGMDSIHDEPAFLVAARRSNADEDLTSTQRAWVACVNARARDVAAAPYSPQRLRKLAERLPRELADPRRFADLPALLAEAGVRLVFVEAFPASKLDGCSLLINRDAPVIGLSGRGKRLDKVLFTLLHEMAHIALGHLDEMGLIVDEESDESETRERDADDLAGRWVLPSPIPPLPERVGQGWIQKIATERGLHPIVITGRLQREERVSWRTALVKGAPNVTQYLETW